MKGGLGNIMKQAQAMQEKLKQAQEELAQTVVDGSAGGGLVQVQMTCRYDVRKVELDPDLLGEDKEVVEDLVAAAVNDAVRKVEAHNRDAMSGLASGLNLPAGFKMPF